MLGTSSRVAVRLWLLAGVGACALMGVAGSAAGALPDGRAYELVSPGQKFGAEIAGESTRTHAAAAESSALPAAVTFPSLGGFADVQGTGIGTEYLAQRDGKPDTSGWSTHAITPPQQPLSIGAAFLGLEPSYVGEMSDDLTKGVFASWSALTAAPNVERVTNLYTRQDLRTPGFGAYQLLTSSVVPLPAPSIDAATYDPPKVPYVAAASDDFAHVVFESRQNLTSDATGVNIKLYKTDNGITRLIDTGPGCRGGPVETAPCSAAGVGAFGLQRQERTISTDGSRVQVTSPVGGTASGVAASKVLQFDDGGSATAADDVLVQLNASEKATPEPGVAATYLSASADGDRVFFQSGEQLTDDAGSGLYLWERQDTDEVQQVRVTATGGTFRLVTHTRPSQGTGTLTNGSSTVNDVNGNFAVGQTITGTGIPAGTTITAASGSSLELSAAATADATGQDLAADVQASTRALAYNATGDEVQAALEATPGIGAGNVSVEQTTDSGTTTYEITFTGNLAGVNVMELTTDPAALTPSGPATATTTTTTPVNNLRLLVALNSSPRAMGASTNGDRLYFSTQGAQLVPGAPAISTSGFYLWQDGPTDLNGTVSFVAATTFSEADDNADSGRLWNGQPRVSRITPDGGVFLFKVNQALFVYRPGLSTPASPSVVCVSCRASDRAIVSNSFVSTRVGSSATAPASHVARVLSSDGRRVFFSTDGALLNEDTNGVSDAYVFDIPSQTLSLLSTGKDRFGSYFMDASANGNDAYFITRERLLGWDVDNGYDLYDARVGGGFNEPVLPPAPCAIDACQGQPATPPTAGPPASSTFKGQGNATDRLRRPTARRRCARGKHRTRTTRGSRCVKNRRARHRNRKARR